MESKRQLHTPEKRRIAQYAAGLIRDGDLVFLDAGHHRGQGHGGPPVCGRDNGQGGLNPWYIQ